MSKKIKANSILLENEIEFIEEVIIEEQKINAYVSTEHLNIEEKFGLKYEDDIYYDMYLNYKYLENKVFIDIVKVEDKGRKYYTYNPTKKEEKMLIKKLETYIEKTYNQNIKDFIFNAEEVEEDEF